MLKPFSLIANLDRDRAAASVLSAWRSHGKRAAAEQLDDLLSNQPALENDFLYKELLLRLSGSTGPRLLVDGLWFSRPPGGITRVWEQILRCWQLPGLLYLDAPVCLIDRDSHLSLTESFLSKDGKKVDPLDAEEVLGVSDENASIASRWGAQVFLSSWISSCGQSTSSCSELALVHDCLPERYQVAEPLNRLRRRWLTGASSHLAVSLDTAKDLETLLKMPEGSVRWCHPAPSPLFASVAEDPFAESYWRNFRLKIGVASPYILLPATSAIGSYKNPELVAKALCANGLETLQLVLCGVGAEQRRIELENHCPLLVGRILAAGFTDFELALVYRHALAVVVPSRIEGFGLPVVEALAAGGVVLIADSRGLREAGGNASLRFSTDQPKQLSDLLKLLLDAESRLKFDLVLERRRKERLGHLNADLIGLYLLAIARQMIT